ncbi:hypothetical protein F1654_07045 [Alkalicaulis satelles]|uniref:Thermonuclease family protein n=1 Tax=Alkalicaulis satelles TaxID=2609175 RepID=A0A5M6ZIB1_9PROT|nr:hypothetical protein [Alkalicaulis satelles]KAA5803554.1 hypothetical protein F1654_07045 [Alkalicaulis satelles]
MAQRVRVCVGAMLAALMLAACGERSVEDAPVLARGAGDASSGHAFTLAGADGTDARVILAGIVTPGADMSPEAATAARAHLEALLDEAGGSLALLPAASGDSLDRYGRLQARAVFPRSGARVELGESLLDAGWALVWPRQGLDLPYADLMAREAEARREGRGAWGLGAFAIRDSDPDRLAQFLDSAQIVEGRVTSTGEARNGRVFLNFGADWRTDFTAAATRASRNRFEQAGVQLETLDGAVVRVRGWVYEENGPMIALTHPAQLEILDAPEPRTLR